jgi:hypothetical protein
VHSRYQSLTGKSVPDLSDFGVTPDEIGLTGKRILICFWDMQQRPARRGVTQLAKQAQALQEKDVKVLLVQVTHLEQKAMDQWLSKYEIPFKSTVLKGELEDKKLAWGVKSLPWLILTDQAHIVRAEGFGLSELSAMIKPDK